MSRRPARTLCRDTRGATIVEFALVLPVMLLLLTGLYDLSFRLYNQAVLTGAVQQAARAAALEGGPAILARIDERVVTAVQEIARDATWRSERRSYATFSAVKAERFTDADGDGQYDPGECFTDTNRNGRWDADAGKTGSQGGASDVTVYTMHIAYPRAFPLGGLIGWPDEQRLSSTTILRNQPYGTQSDDTPPEVCP